MKYNIILADPPWPYNKRNNPKNTKFGGGAVGHYELMKVSEIASLRVDKISQDNCALFLWTTWPHMFNAGKVINAWGFDYKTDGFLWLKTNKKNKKIYFGTGYYTKSNTEPCLLAVKGRMKPISNYVSQVIEHPIMGHSAKPPIVREKIVELFGDLPRIELFARDIGEGWDAMGYEIDGRDIREILV